jgi:predicted O-linked N-acetylglucosamine transferase (SPINDLY family)
MPSTSLTDALKQAMQLHGAQRYAEAESAYRQILASHPAEPFVAHLLGLVELQTGRIDAAIVNLEAAVSSPAARFEWFAATVNTCVAQGQFDRAIRWQQKVIALRPALPDGHFRLSELFAASGKFDEAAETLKQAISLGGGDPAVYHNNLGATYSRLGRFAEAATAYRQAISIQPSYAVAHRNLGDALRHLGDYPAAEASYRAAARFDPSMADAFNGIGLTFYLRGKFADAIPQFQSASKLNPADANPLINLVLCHGRLGDQERIAQVLHELIKIAPSDAKAHSTLVMLMNYTHGHEPPTVLNESLNFNRLHAEPVHPQSVPGTASTSPLMLRIGYISPDFCRHPVAVFFEPLLRHHDRGRFKIACYASVDRPDAVTERFKKLADLWRDIAGQSDEEVARQIREDRIDILIDLAGHSSENRLLVLARKPAPIQMTWLGYPNTTGIAAIDYRFTDAWADPIGVEPFYTEKLVRLPDAFFVYQPPEAEVRVTPLPMLGNGFVTFASFNNITKVTPAMLRIWSEILRQTPGAKLLMAGIPPDAQQRLLSGVVAPGVDASRIEFPQTTDFEQFLHLHDRVDIALDAFPYTGHTTTCNCLWMGVPVVSLAGPTAVSRVGASIMANLDMLDEWVATTEQDYIHRAVTWAARPEHLRTLRSRLRDRLLRSKLTDAVGFAANFESALLKLRT